jgi:hypothetical protein
MTTWTTPRTWTSETLTSTLLNTHLRDNLNHLKENLPPGLAGSADIAGVGGAGTSEEWGTTTTGLTWSPSNPTTVDSHTTIPNHLYISNQADTTERLGTKSWSPGAGAFDGRLGSVLIGANASAAAVTSFVGLHIGDSGNSNRLMMQVSYVYNTGVTQIAAYTYAASTYTARGSAYTVPSSVPVYLRIARDGSNNVSFYWSLNGVLWNLIATQAFTLTVSNIGVRAVGNATAVFQAAADWLRTSV